MRVVTLAWRNLFRHKRRTLLTLSALIIGLAGLVIFQGYLAQTMKGFRDQTIRAGLGHLQVATSDEYFVDGEFNGGAYPLATSEQWIKTWSSDDRVAAVAPSLGFTAIAGVGEKSSALLVKAYPLDRMSFTSDPTMSTFFLGTLVRGQLPARSGTHALILGQTAARILKADVGTVLTLMVLLPNGGLNGADFTVTAVYQSAGRDKSFAFTDLESAQDFTGLLQPSVVHAFLKNPGSAEALVSEARGATGPQGSLRTWHDLAGFYVSVNTMFQSFLGVIRVILLLITLFILANTMNRIVFERMREWGTLRAMGTKKAELVALVVTEGALLGLVGTVLGLVCGFTLSLGINLMGGLPFINGNETYLIKVSPDDQSVWANLFPVAATAAVAALFPALRAARMTPSECLRHV